LIYDFCSSLGLSTGSQSSTPPSSTPSTPAKSNAPPATPHSPAPPGNPPSAPAADHNLGPADDKQVIALLESGYNSADVQKLIETRGYTGGADPDTLKKIREAGAAPDLILLIGAKASSTDRSSSAPPASPPATPPRVEASSSGPADGQHWTNSLGMKFVPASTPGVLFAVDATRVQDFQAFTDATQYDATANCISPGPGGWMQRGDNWKNPGFSQGTDYPVVGVSWTDAEAFCRWLTASERKAGKIRQDQSYRLPTDAEWSVAVGAGKYPWGDQWPPPPEAGNFARYGDGYASEIAGKDGYTFTAPVGSFTPNDYGLYDMGGNVSQWCEDWYNASMNAGANQAGLLASGDGGGREYRVLRGSAWNIYIAPPTRSDARGHAPPDFRSADNGFRCVLVVSPSP
jgi:hypothetical protein